MIDENIRKAIDKHIGLHLPAIASVVETGDAISQILIYIGQPPNLDMAGYVNCITPISIAYSQNTVNIYDNYNDVECKRHEYDDPEMLTQIVKSVLELVYYYQTAFARTRPILKYDTDTPTSNNG